MFCTRARSCARADDAKSCAVGMRNAKPGNHLKLSKDVRKSKAENKGKGKETPKGLHS